MRLGNISKDFEFVNMKKKTELNEYVCEFSVDYNIIDASNITNIHKYLMKKTWYKIMFGLIKKCLLYY